MIDIQHTANGDIDFAIGDLLYTESTEQHQKDILLSGKGHYKECPELGVDATEYVNDNGPENLLRSIRNEFIRDGMKVTQVNMNNTIAEYEEDNS